MYCPNCGAQVADGNAFCVNCGTNIAGRPVVITKQVPPADSGMITAVKVFLILGCIGNGVAILPLLWCIPITAMIFNRIKNRQLVGTGLKVASLLLVSFIGGILLVASDNI